MTARPPGGRAGRGARPAVVAGQARYDAIVVGAGPNGLAAAVTLARAGLAVLVREAAPTIGGGARSAELTLPGFVHDVCSAIHPLGAYSPVFRALPLARHGLAWVHPDAPLAHPLDDGTAAVLERSIAATGATLGPDASAYRDLIAPLVDDWPRLAPSVLAPPRWPRHPLALARFGLNAALPARLLAERRFAGEVARGLFAGLAAHSVLPLEQPPTAAFSLIMAVLGHVAGWPLARGGSQAIVDALAGYLRELGGEIATGAPVASLAELPPARAVLCDVTPRQLVRLAGDRLPGWYRRRLGRFRYGPGVCKVDWALDGPIPWRAADCARAGTVHVGGPLAEVAAGERAVWRGEHPARPFVLVAQQSLFDPTRAPEGQQVAWAYCHAPHGSPVDLSDVIEGQIERFAPGFRDRILARHVMTAAAMEGYNANYIGGDIAGGLHDLRQIIARPTPSPDPYATPAPGLYLCSSSTPPGAGVHGLCGYFAARSALRRSFGKGAATAFEHELAAAAGAAGGT